MTEGDLGLGTSTHLDICTGTAVCSRLGEESSVSHVEEEDGTAALYLHTHLMQILYISPIGFI